MDATISRTSPATRESPVAMEKMAVLRAIRPPLAGRVSAATGCYSKRRRGRSPRPLHVMANIASQKKRIQRTERERLENRRYTSTIKTYFRRLEAAVEAKDDATADADFKVL